MTPKVLMRLPGTDTLKMVVWRELDLKNREDLRVVAKVWLSWIMFIKYHSSMLSTEPSTETPPSMPGLSTMPSTGAYADPSTLSPKSGI